ncbi:MULTISPECIES: Uma2 family endonuclease [Cyanophyceae]|uniref:Uma2 family endonuclease n=1 Tax=Leptolyngbya subtilissima DQ-A4 TaxID=2933933 RepID=A0ABV0KBJ6_9CYAN|nr:Uma2 family endonuclease [Nodosilinea sp. FACHB-141]MBD2114075.1 Uma2 family endonuclease [Nodosilinea sp. FACHB-141]
MTAYTIKLQPALTMTDEQFYQLCITNPDLKFERNAQGDLLIMSPTGGETGNRNVELATEFVLWNRQHRLGVVFDSSTGFKLPGGGDRSPDVAWVEQSRWDALNSEQRQKFPPIAPDFVLELLSPSDRLSVVQTKMQEYMASGVRLGWLINPSSRQVEVYQPEQVAELLNNPIHLSGEPVLPGFVLDMNLIW